MTIATALTRAVAIAGSESKLSRVTGYSQPAINKARRRGRVSAEMAIAIERALKGRRVSPGAAARPVRGAE